MTPARSGPRASWLLVFLSLAAFLTPLPSQELFRRSDADDDGATTITDAVFILHHLFIADAPSPGCDDAADANDDGRLNISDALAILGWLFAGKGEPPPPPFPDCGGDPSDDGLGCAGFESCAVLPRFENTIGMQFVYIPPGSFFMGSPPEEEGRSDWPDAETLHKVHLTCGYYLGVTEVTQAQYVAVMGIHPARDVIDLPNAPVTLVSWFNAVEFCRRLSERDGQRYRLPTEAEWEYACRAGTTTSFFFGEDPGCGVFDRGAPCEYSRRTVCKLFLQYAVLLECHAPPIPWWTVASRKPNPWGLYDMSGSVSEWCHDRYAPFSPDEVTNPVGPPTGELRVLRGGGSPQQARSAARARVAPHADYNLSSGFRIVREICDYPGLTQ